MPILKIVKTRQISLFLQFSQKEIDEVSHRAICSQVYDCLFSSTHLAKKYFEFRWCVQSQQIFMSTTRPGFFVDLIFASQYVYLFEANTYTHNKAEGTMYTQAQQSNTNAFICMCMCYVNFLS